MSDLDGFHGGPAGEPRELQVYPIYVVVGDRACMPLGEFESLEEALERLVGLYEEHLLELPFGVMMIEIEERRS